MTNTLVLTVLTQYPEIAGSGHFLDLLRVMDSNWFYGPIFHCCGREKTNNTKSRTE